MFVVACDLRYGGCPSNVEALAVLIVVAALAIGARWYLRQRS